MNHESVPSRRRVSRRAAFTRTGFLAQVKM